MTLSITDNTASTVAGILGESISDRVSPALKQELSRLHNAFKEMAMLIDRVNNNPLTFFTANVGYAVFTSEMTEVDVYCTSAVPVNGTVEFYNNGGTLAARTTLNRDVRIDAVALEDVAVNTVGRFMLHGLFLFNPGAGQNPVYPYAAVQCYGCNSVYVSTNIMEDYYLQLAHDVVGPVLEIINSANLSCYFSPNKWKL